MDPWLEYLQRERECSVCPEGTKACTHFDDQTVRIRQLDAKLGNRPLYEVAHYIGEWSESHHGMLNNIAWPMYHRFTEKLLRSEH